MINVFKYSLIGFILFLCSSHGVFSKPENIDLTKCLKKSIHATETLPFEGILYFRTLIPDVTKNIYITKVRLLRLAPGRRKMVLIEPSFFMNHTLAEIDDSLWVTPLPEEEFHRLLRKIPISPHHWFRIFRHCAGAVQKKDMELFLKNYELSRERTGPVAGRKVIAIVAKTKYTANYIKRPSLRIYIDKESFMPLKYDRFDYDGDWTETVEFESITIGKDQLTGKTIDTSELRKLPPRPEDGKEKVQLDFVPLKPGRLPRGFIETSSNTFVSPNDDVVIHETHYKDGLSHFSTYQRRQKKEEREQQLKEPKEERDKPRKTQEFGRDVYFRELAGVRIHVVGNIYPDTMKFILYNIKPGKE